MTRIIAHALFAASFWPSIAAAQGADANSVLGRDNAPRPEERRSPGERQPVIRPADDGASTPAVSGEVQIGAVQVTGLEWLSQADFADIAERYSGRSVDTGGLQGLARDIADRARERGYIFATATVPAQQMSLGIIRVAVDEGAIDTVRVAGSENRRLKMLLGGLAGTAVRKPELERRLLLAQDIAGVRIIDTRFAREDGKGVLIVDARDERTRGSATLDNWGPEAFGPVRARLEFELDGLLDDDDQLVSTVIATPLEPDELTYVSARYANVISEGGLQLSLTGGAGRTHERERAFNFEADGRSLYAAVGLTRPLLRANDASVWLSSDFAWQRVTQDFAAGARQRDDMATLTLSGWGNMKMASGRLQGGVAVTRGLGILGATGAGDPQASRLDGSGRFTRANAWLNWNGKIAGSVSMRLAANGQVASRPLLAAQEIGLGGPYYGRGYDFSERFGDQGILGLAELRRNFDRPPGLDWAHVYGFVDGGYVDNLRGGIGGGSLMSGGGGVRAGLGRTEFGLEVAAPINADRFEAGDKSPKVNFVVSLGF